MTVEIPGHEWSEEALFAKAQLYIEQMEACPHDDWQFGFWSALSLEFLARAALAHISPVLLADQHGWNNLAHALGHQPTSQKFLPKSIPAIELFKRLQVLITDFNPEMHAFCIKHTTRRNSELHSGNLEFAGLPTSDWLPKFYWVCDTLLTSMENKLSMLISDSDAAHAMIESLKDESAKAVQKDISAHKQVWVNKSGEEQRMMSLKSETWAVRQLGHRTDCPSCESVALLSGRPGGPVLKAVDDEEAIERQAYVPSSFECIACGLKISGFSKLLACGLGDTFTRTSRWTVAEYYDLHTREELEEARGEFPEYEPDFNE